MKTGKIDVMLNLLNEDFGVSDGFVVTKMDSKKSSITVESMDYELTLKVLNPEKLDK